MAIVTWPSWPLHFFLISQCRHCFLLPCKVVWMGLLPSDPSEYNRHSGLSSAGPSAAQEKCEWVSERKVSQDVWIGWILEQGSHEDWKPNVPNWENQLRTVCLYWQREEDGRVTSSSFSQQHLIYHASHCIRGLCLLQAVSKYKNSNSSQFLPFISHKCNQWHSILSYDPKTTSDSASLASI